jgi:hypothetical protein
VLTTFTRAAKVFIVIGSITSAIVKCANRTISYTSTFTVCAQIIIDIPACSFVIHFTNYLLTTNTHSLLAKDSLALEVHTYQTIKTGIIPVRGITHITELGAHGKQGAGTYPHTKNLAGWLFNVNSTRLEVALAHTAVCTGIKSVGNVAKLTRLAVLGELGTDSSTVGDGFACIADEAISAFFVSTLNRAGVPFGLLE